MTLASTPTYDAGRLTRTSGDAVVVGAGVAGLCAARVLADVFDRVVVIDQDPLPYEPVERPGVPQSRHVHQLLESGRATMEELFPGFVSDLLAAGAVEFDACHDTRLFIEGGLLAEGVRHRSIYSATRALYEATLRRHVAARDGLELRPECRLATYRLDSRAVTGVEVRARDGTVQGLEADLVVDATGRGSRTPAWLEANGFERPPVDEVHIDLTYATATVERDPDEERVVVVMPTPDRPRGASAVPVEGDRWMVTLSGMHGTEPPADRAGFEAYVEDFPLPDLHRFLRAGAWTSDHVARYPFPANRRHRYEAVDRFPDGLLVVGDAVASFNPIYGQGMSVAALEALGLYGCLAEGGTDGLAPRFFDRIEPTVDLAWNLATMGDHQFPQTTGPRPRAAGLLHWYVSRLLRRARHDGRLLDAFFDVQMLERPPTSLLRPGVAWRVLRPRW